MKTISFFLFCILLSLPGNGASTSGWGQGHGMFGRGGRQIAQERVHATHAVSEGEMQQQIAQERVHATHAVSEGEMQQQREERAKAAEERLDPSALTSGWGDGVRPFDPRAFVVPQPAPRVRQAPSAGARRRSADVVIDDVFNLFGRGGRQIAQERVHATHAVSEGEMQQQREERAKAAEERSEHMRHASPDVARTIPGDASLIEDHFRSPLRHGDESGASESHEKTDFLTLDDDAQAMILTKKSCLDVINICRASKRHLLSCAGMFDFLNTEKERDIGDAWSQNVHVPELRVTCGLDGFAPSGLNSHQIHQCNLYHARCKCANGRGWTEVPGTSVDGIQSVFENMKQGDDIYIEFTGPRGLDQSLARDFAGFLLSRGGTFGGETNHAGKVEAGQALLLVFVETVDGQVFTRSSDIGTTGDKRRVSVSIRSDTSPFDRRPAWWIPGVTASIHLISTASIHFQSSIRSHSIAITRVETGRCRRVLNA